MSGSTCSWCHEFCPASEASCPNCGHEAHVSRLNCGCWACAPEPCWPEYAPCTVCRRNQVNVAQGHDTCSDCLARQ